MTGSVETAGGAVYVLPEPMEWRMQRTGGVPCDSFRLRCLFRAEMAEVLKDACRFTAEEGGEVLLRGVVDGWSAELSGAGTVLTVEGRGMAALLLDNEAEAVHYQRATLEEILKDHAAVCGVRWETERGGQSLAEYSVASGSSRWRAIEGFARRCGLRPYFTREGVLRLRAEEEEKACRLGALSGVLGAVYRDRRCGVVSEITVVNRSLGLRRKVRNEAFIARGGSCRRMLYVPARSADELRYTGEYQIEKSAEGARELTLTLAGRAEIEPGERVELTLSQLGAAGVFRVSELLHTISVRGETTELTLWEV